MELTAASLDDLLRKVFNKLLDSKTKVKGSRGELAGEKLGVSLKLTQPLARLSRTESRGKVFSALGELFWYLSGSNSVDHIAYYIPKYKDEAEQDGTVWGAYGPRLRNLDGKQNQLENVCTLLHHNRTSKRAVVQLFSGHDIAEPNEPKNRKREIPCTCSMQFLVRRDKKRRKDTLHMFTWMRSNDAYKGLQHDVFAFTMIQELVARSIDVELGTYHHFAGSLHLYSDDQTKVERFLDEGWQATVAMPPMPIGSQWANVEKVIKCESALRTGSLNDNPEPKDLPNYWLDIIRLFKIYKHRQEDDEKAVARVRSKMISPVYHAYLQPRKKPTLKLPEEAQPTLALPK